MQNFNMVTGNTIPSTIPTFGAPTRSKILPQRTKVRATAADPNAALAEAQSYLNSGNYLAALDIIEELAAKHRDHEVALLSKVYEIYQNVPDKESRYWLYQARHFDFDIKPGQKVLDIGSGNIPFPFATHLGDIAVTDHRYGRAGEPFKHQDGKPVYECDIENMPFKDGEFDFVYCSHVLEHVHNPEKACSELQRIAKRGYIETPIRGKDLFLDTGAVSNHIWKVELFNEKLIFTEYEREELLGFQCGVMLDMRCNPQTDRERAFAALLLLKSSHVNTMLMWQDSIDVEVRRLSR